MLIKTEKANDLMEVHEWCFEQSDRLMKYWLSVMVTVMNLKLKQNLTKSYNEIDLCIHIFHENQLIDSHWDWEWLERQIVF